MNGQRYCLQTFPSAFTLPHLQITGSMARSSNRLDIRYALRGHLAEIAIPLPADMPTRRDRLWEETCFEFFLAVKNSPRYWEFNLSPSGDWNVYGFAGYRQGMHEEPAFASLPFDVKARSDALELTLELDLGKIVRADQPLEVAISAVIKPRTGEATYWALTHGTPRADFHRRDHFLIEL
jgi:hypothetical protein